MQTDSQTHDRDGGRLKMESMMQHGDKHEPVQIKASRFI